MHPPTQANFQKAYILDFFCRSQIFNIALPRTYLLTAPVNETLHTQLRRCQYTARNPRGTRRMKREFALGIKSLSSILSREVVYASLFKHCPYLFIRVWVRPDSEAGFSIGFYHTGQPPMLDVKGKGGIPSMEAGTNEWIKIVRSKDAHSKSGCWTRVCGFRTGKSRYKVVVRKQCSRWKRDHLLSCCSRQLLAKDSFACRRSSRLA